MATTKSDSVPAVPVEPIIVLGKKGEFLYPVPTLALAIEYTNRYLAHDGDGPRDSAIRQQGRFTLDDLDFFDALGRQLAVVRKGNLIESLILSHSEEIRARIDALLEAARKEAEKYPDRPDYLQKVPAVPDGRLSFDGYLDAIMNDESIRFDEDMHCNFVLLLFGRCR